MSTVYAVFRNKRGILQAIRERWHQESGQRDIYRQAIGTSRPQKPFGIGCVCHTSSVGNQRRDDGDLPSQRQPLILMRLQKLSTALQGRRTFLTHFIDEMSEQLRPDLSPTRAVAIFYTLTQPTIYQELVGEDGWSPEEYEVWLAGTLQQQLLSSGC